MEALLDPFMEWVAAVSLVLVAARCQELLQTARVQFGRHRNLFSNLNLSCWCSWLTANLDTTNKCHIVTLTLRGVDCKKGEKKEDSKKSIKMFDSNSLKDTVLENSRKAN